MTFETIIMLMLLFVLNSAFSQGCSSFNPNNFNECLQCGTDFYLTQGNCFPCPKTGSNNLECKTDAIPNVSSALSTEGISNPKDSVQDPFNVSSISASSFQETTSTTKTDNLTSTSTATDNSSQNDQQATIQNNSNHSNFQLNIEPTTISSPTLRDSSISNLLNQLLLSLLPPHCTQFKFVSQLQCSKCQFGYNLSSIKKCQPSAQNITTTSASTFQKIATDAIILKTNETLSDLNLSIPIAATEVKKKSFIPMQAILANQLKNKTPVNNESNQTFNNQTTSTPIITVPTTTITPQKSASTISTSTNIPSVSTQPIISVPTATVIPSTITSTSTPASTISSTTIPSTISNNPTNSVPIIVAEGIIPIDTVKMSTNKANTTDTTNTINTTSITNISSKIIPSINMPKSGIIKDYNCMSSNSKFSFSTPISLTNCRCILCYNGFYYDLSHQICMPTNPLCKTSDNQNHCLTCYVGYVVLGGNCIVNDGKATTNSQNTLSYTPAAAIDPNCQKYYENLTSCQICANRFFLNTNTNVCMAIDTSCKTWNSSNGYCTSCYSGYTSGSNDRVCKPIILPTVSSSNTLNNKQFCKTTKNRICTSCVYRYFLSNGYCLPVSNLCRTFNATFGFCTSCYDGYILQDGTCVIPPVAVVNPDPNCYDYTDIGCITCLSNYFLNSQGWCQLVRSYCNGYNPTNGFCLACIFPYTLNQQTGECVYLN